VERAKVLIISVVDYTDSGNGGGLWAANLLESIALVSDVDFTVVSMGDPRRAAVTDEFVRKLGLDPVFVPFHSPRRSGVMSGQKASTAMNMLLDKYYFEWERESRRQTHVDQVVRRLVDERKPDLIIVSYLFSALFAPSIFSVDVPVSLISLNREAEFHRSFRAVGGPTGQKLSQRIGRWIHRRFNWISGWRIAAYEKWVHHQCAGIVALTQNDLPQYLHGNVVTAVLPPLFKRNPMRWQHRANRRVFFVGNMGHYPNQLAIEWICSRFAAELLRLDPSIFINIIGASTDQVPPAWRLPNVNFMGVAGKEEVIQQMTTADLFIAPIANQFGAKIKLAECVSYGMPFLATGAAMSGLPFLKDIPEIVLDEPEAAALRVARYVNERGALTDLSESITRQVEIARSEQALAWRSFIWSSIEEFRSGKSSGS
jgi:hypothetical protein